MILMGSRKVLYSVLLIAVCIFGILYYQLTSDQITTVAEKEMLGGGTYTGEMKKGLFHGEGVFEATTGVVYEGEFEDGYFHGEGRLIFPGGNTLVGRFERGFVVERYKIVRPDGTIETFNNERVK